MSWQIPTYAAARYTNNLPPEDRLPTKVVENVVRHKCPLCPQWAQGHVFIDVRNFPVAFLSQFVPPAAPLPRFVCDGCWNSWEMQKVPAGDGRMFDESILNEFAGAPADYVAESRRRINERNKWRAERLAWSTHHNRGELRK